MIHSGQPRLLVMLGLVVCLLAPAPAPLPAAEPEDEEEIELERTVELRAQLIGVEEVPTRGATLIARFRVTDGEYRGSMLSLVYEILPPVRLRSWDVHDPSGYRRIGGARVTEPPNGQWDSLLRTGSYEPVETIALSLIQHDLNEDEERRRWHFKRIESIVPLEFRDPLDPVDAARSRRRTRYDR